MRPAFVILERDARQHGIEIGRLRSMSGQEVEERLVIQMHEHPADVEHYVTNQAASVDLQIAAPFYGGAGSDGVRWPAI